MRMPREVDPPPRRLEGVRRVDEDDVCVGSCGVAPRVFPPVQPVGSQDT
ncbi:MAG: hypothetical protein ACO2PM_10330 [Pyrobaculum sp.]